MDNKAVTPHLTDPELFTLAAPPVGEPEALPRHLSECLTCSRALLEWKAAVRELAEAEIEPLERRPAAEWEALENKTIEAMRRAGRSHRASALKWGMTIAATLLLAAFLVPMRRSDRGAGASASTAALSTQDPSDDALLRDVARLSRGEDYGSWGALAPEPGMTVTEEEQL
jgi:hypothetical protein